MLPEFPDFKPIELSDKEDIEAITDKYPPYSDFNFVSMWSWDVKGEMRISQLYGNLVVRFTDYITGEPFYSFLGDNQVNGTTKALLELSKKEGLKPILKFITEPAVGRLDVNFKCTEDRDNFDYIYDLQLISEYKGNKFAEKRSSINHLLLNFPKLSVEDLDFKTLSIQKEILSLNKKWLKGKLKEYFNFRAENEFLAIDRLFQLDRENIIGVGVFNGRKLIAYSVFELLKEKYSICHFSKADIHFEGIYDYIARESAKILANQGSIFLNYEQDLGIDSLRVSKTRYRPISFFKKYLVQ